MKSIAIKVLTTVCALAVTGCSSDSAYFPSLTGTDAQEGIYANNSNVVNGSYTGTFVGQRVAAFRQELNQIKQAQKSNEREFEKINSAVSANSSLYQKTISAVEAKLQAGTTPGNPNLYATLQQAQGNVQTMFANVSALENLSTKTANTLTSINYLENSISAAFNISGAVDEDHKQLRDLQNQAITVAQQASALNENVTKAANFQQQTAVQASQEINNLHNSVKNGNNTTVSSRPILHSALPMAKPMAREMSHPNYVNASANRIPLFSVRFNNPNVDYHDGLNTAVKSALNRKANATFEVVAISNTANQNQAQKHASTIMNEIVALGANSGNVNLNAQISEKSSTSEVRVFVK